MSETIVEFVEKFEFEGDPWRVITINGRPCWIAKEVGKSLEYGKDGTGLVDLINKEWVSSFEEGKHYEFLNGKKLRDFKQLLKGCGFDPISEFVSKLMVLYKAGINKVLLKSNKPKADRIQDWFVDEVLAQIDLDGRYSPDRTVEDGEIVGSLSEDCDPATKVAMEREARLAEQFEYRKKRDILKLEDQQKKKYEAQQKKMYEARQKKYEEEKIRSNILKKAKEYGCSFEAEVAFFKQEIDEAEIKLEVDFTNLKQGVENFQQLREEEEEEEEQEWFSPKQIAKQLGTTEEEVEEIITKLGLRDPGKYPKHCKVMIRPKEEEEEEEEE